MGTIAACPAAMSKLTRLGVSAINSDSPIASWLSFTGFDPGISVEALELGDNVNTGTLSSLESQYRNNRNFVDPSYQGQPTPADWRLLLPWILDGTETGAGTAGSPYAYPLANLLTRRYMLWDDSIGTWNLHDVCVDTASISASTGDAALKLSLGLVSTLYDQAASFPGGLVPETDSPFIFTDGTITVGGTPIKCESFGIQVAKNVAKDRFFNSQNIACAVAQNRKVSISINGYPWGLHASLFAAGQSTSVPVVCTFTYGLKVLTFTMPKVRQPPKAPDAQVPREIVNNWSGHALASATLNDELSATLSLV